MHSWGTQSYPHQDKNEDKINQVKIKLATQPHPRTRKSSTLPPQPCSQNPIAGRNWDGTDASPPFLCSSHSAPGKPGLSSVWKSKERKICPFWNSVLCSFRLHDCGGTAAQGLHLVSAGTLGTPPRLKTWDAGGCPEAHRQRAKAWLVYFRAGNIFLMIQKRVSAHYEPLKPYMPSPRTGTPDSGLRVENKVIFFFFFFPIIQTTLKSKALVGCNTGESSLLD